MTKIVKNILIIIIIIIILIAIINVYIIHSVKNKIKPLSELNDNDIDCILVLGAGIKNNQPSPMLEDRLLTSLDIYNQNITSKIIVSGDHGQIEYDEVNVMKNYLIEQGVSSENIFMDHAGFSTYDSIYRAKEIFNVEKVIIVTQKYHLYRALYIAQELDIEAYGVVADQREYRGQLLRELREVIARIKDILKCILKPPSQYLGDKIDINSNGNITNDK